MSPSHVINLIFLKNQKYYHRVCEKRGECSIISIKIKYFILNPLFNISRLTAQLKKYFHLAGPMPHMQNIIYLCVPIEGSRGRAARQRSAKPSTAVRIRSRPQRGDVTYSPLFYFPPIPFLLPISVILALSFIIGRITLIIIANKKTCNPKPLQ